METRSRMSRSLHTNRDFEKLEPYEGKPSRTVLRGEEGSNALDLPDRYVMGVRDIIVHHYFDVDADEIYRICLEDIPQLQQAIKRMLDDLKMDNLIMG